MKRGEERATSWRRLLARPMQRSHRRGANSFGASGGGVSRSAAGHPHPVRPATWPGSRVRGVVGDGRSKPRTHRPPPCTCRRPAFGTGGGGRRRAPASPPAHFDRRYQPSRVEELAQVGLQDLAVVVLRQRLDEAIALRALEAGDVVEAQAIERGAATSAPSRRTTKAIDLLAPIGMRPADDRRLQHAGVRQQHLLDLARIDVGRRRR